MEVKTDKVPKSKYQKREVGQLSDHVQWVKDNKQSETIIPVFIGPISGVTETANPSPDFLVIDLEQFHELSKRLEAALNDISSNALPLTLVSTVSKVFNERGLFWPQYFHSLESFCLRDL